MTTITYCKGLPTPADELNPIGFTELEMFLTSLVDGQGNLKAQGTLPFQTGLPTGKQDAQIVEVCLKLAALARSFQSPILCERLDFSTKKAQLRERGKKYARMLSAWAYSRFYQILSSILSNRGITLSLCNPAYTSLIGLVKYSRMYGLSSDVAADKSNCQKRNE